MQWQSDIEAYAIPLHRTGIAQFSMLIGIARHQRPSLDDGQTTQAIVQRKGIGNAVVQAYPTLEMTCVAQADQGEGSPGEIRCQLQQHAGLMVLFASKCLDPFRSDGSIKHQGFWHRVGVSLPEKVAVQSSQNTTISQRCRHCRAFDVHPGLRRAATSRPWRVTARYHRAVIGHLWHNRPFTARQMSALIGETGRRWSCSRGSAFC